MRCVIRKLRNKIVSIFLVVSISLTLVLSGAFAYVQPSEITLSSFLDGYGVKSTFTTFYNQLVRGNDGLDFDYCLALTYVNLNNNPNTLKYWMIFICNTPFTVFDNGNYGTVDAGGKLYVCYGDTYYHGFTTALVLDNSNSLYTNPYDLGNPQWMRDSMDTEYNLVYSNFQTLVCNLTVTYNLDTSDFFNPPPVDSRIFEVWKSVDYPESSNPLEYINVLLDGYVDLNRISTQKIRFDYIDQDGNNQFKVFTESDFHDIQYDSSEDVYTFYIFPYLISSYEFTLTSATYYSQTEWAEKTIQLDLTYNEGTIYPLPQDWNSVYTVNQYFSSRSNGTVNGGVTKLALSDTGYLWIDYYQKVCKQVFDVKVLFIPYFMNSDLLSINLETLYQLYEQFDVIFTGVQPTQFNLLIPTLDYNDLYVYYSQNGFYPALQKLQEHYVFYSNLKFQNDYSDYSWSLSTDEVGFIVTRSFLLKRTLTALGDIDNRLLEFETNLVGEDSLGVSLQTKLDNILSLEHNFFTDVSNFFQKLEYNLNGLSLGRIEKYLEDIWSATVGERNFNYTDLLPEPLKSIFLYFRGWFISSTQYMQDFIEVSNSSLYGDDLMTLPFEASTVPVLPFEPGTPTPIPIPTLEAGLIEVGGD